MAGVRTAIPRAIGLIALMACVVFALRGYLPGTGGPHAPSPPSAVTVALMPVLSLVSVVILLAGVLTSQHHAPLAMAEVDRDRKRQPFRLSRFGIVILIGTAVAAVLTAIVWAVYLLAGGREEAPAPRSNPPATAQQPETTAPPTTQPFSGAPELSGHALLFVGVCAAVLVAVAILGLGVVAFGARDGRGAAAVPPVSAPAEAPVSLAQVAEMGLAAMMASGKDARAAIIACYVAMESGLAQAREVAPLVSDTPSEVLARAFDRGVLHDASARELVTLFEEARFSPHSILEWQRMRAEQLLRIVLADLQGARL
ncbi:putative membrane protein [Nocardia kruczakiae]|uniref:Membrane protein n=1 Tax=Nocardia kruczakiae TaxID=261477 RepID=A0ABU1XJS0_9NOCA|nr:DUF4129 domain-containing protein [Nocardia kruczakiae]MDR7170796.1 putative membrane protein [Nocardia kruczakiae]